MATLRFALLIRVSSQIQDDDGHSLETQRVTLIQDVHHLGGTVTKIYEGVESAYKEKRPILDQLIIDISLNIFDAIIVYDLSRLSRNTAKALTVYGHLKKHNIKLFIRTQEFDPNSPEHKMMFTVLTAVNEFHSSVNNSKAMAVKKLRAAKGFPSTGEIPFARICKNIKSADEVPIWDIDPLKREIADKIFEYYVNENKSYYEIAQLTGLHQGTIKDILGRFAGEDWSVIIDDTTYKIKVPALFTEEQIRKIEEAKKLHLSQCGKHIGEYGGYVLASFVKCSYCGRRMSSSKNPIGNRYYKHYYSPLFRPSKNCIGNISALYLERIVFAQLGEIIASNEKLKEAITNVTSTLDVNEVSLKKEIENLEIRFNEEQTKKGRIVSSISKGIITDSDAREEMSKIKNNLETIGSELDKKKKKLEFIKSEFPQDFDKSVKEFFDLICEKEGRILQEWDDELKREILKVFFGDVANENIGIFVKKLGSKHFAYEIKGLIVNASGTFQNNDYDSILNSEFGTWMNKAKTETNLDIESLRKVVEVVTRWNRAESPFPARPARLISRRDSSWSQR